MAGFEPTAVVGFDKDHMAGFEPTAVVGFDKDHMAEFDFEAMEGFEKDHIANFDPEAVSGFERGHVVGMDLEAMTGFEHDQVKNLNVEAKVGFGDKVPVFEDFSIEIRLELVDESEMLLGGVGAFDDLAKLAVADPATIDAAELKELGWDKAAELIAKIESIEMGKEAAPITVPDDAAAKALAAFAATQ
jgi:hypothetical protein